MAPVFQMVYYLNPFVLTEPVSNFFSLYIGHPQYCQVFFHLVFPSLLTPAPAPGRPGPPRR